MRKITFEDFYNENKKELQIYIFKDEFKFNANRCNLYNINIEQYLNAISADNLKLLVFKFYLPRQRTKCVQIFYSEEKSGYFKNIKKKWQYKIMSKNGEALLEEDILTSHLCNILNNEDQDIRISIKDFFVALGCDTDRILLNKVSQQALNYDDFKNKEVLTNEN